MDERKIKWISRGFGWLGAGIVLALFWRGDIVDHFRDRQARNHLRAEACALMVERAFLRQELGDRCERNVTTYLDGLNAAVFSQTDRLQKKVEEEETALKNVTAALDHSMFVPIEMDDFLAQYEPFALLETEQKPENEKSFAINANWIMMTGYGDIRIEKPNSSNEETNAASFAVDASLGLVRNGMLNRICRRVSTITLGCRGTVYVVAGEDFLRTYTVVGVELDEITTEQINSTSLDMFMPTFQRASPRLQAFYFQRFINAFSEQRDE